MKHDEIFVHVVRHISIRILLVMVALKLKQFDMKIVFLHVDLEKTIYIKQSKRSVVNWKEY